MDTTETTDLEVRIIEAAKQVFIRKGYAATTMSDVAAEVGIGRTALHYYFRTKDILFEAIFGQLLASFLPNIDRVLDEDRSILEKMPKLIDHYMWMVRSNPLLPGFIISELKRDPEYLFQTISKNPQQIQPVMRLRQQVEDEMERGLIKRIPIVDLLTTVVSMVVFPVLIQRPLMMSFMDNDVEQFDAYMERRKKLIVDVVMRLLSPDFKE